MLVVIDNRPLRHAAWSEFHSARKRLDKSARDLHRHEQADTPAYQAWMHGAFPVLITTLRELHEETTVKRHQVDSVRLMGALTGRSLKKLWREYLEESARPPDFQAPPPEPAADDRADPDAGDPFFEDFFDDEPARPGREPAEDERNGFFRDETPPPSPDARETYRRLVQHLHPDRGGAWTPAREHLWHEVQQAWAARDADWLARLEIEWETANDTLGADSSLGRLSRAVAELHAARRDIDRKLRAYRGSFAWRFTLTEKKRPQLHRRVETDLLRELGDLRRHLDYFNATIAAWESPLPGRGRRGK